MEITKVKLTRTNVHIEYENEGDSYKYDSKDKPLPSFYEAMEALAPLAITTLGLPKSYVGKKPTEGDREPGLPLTVNGITIVTKGEARQVCIVATKVLGSCPSPFNITVPLRYMDQPDEEGSASEPYGPKEVALLEEVIAQAKGYLRGERAQGQLPLEETVQPPAEPEDGNDEALPFTAK
jgi:hypothetical protein